MYQKYTTEALVLGGRERGEADRVYALYTREFGLVHARASAVRSEHSRMRYALQSYARVRVSLVRGTRGWRVAGAAAIACVQGGGAHTFARIATLALRLIQGQERNTYLFAALAEAHAALFARDKGPAFISEGEDALPIIEIVCVARVLYALGYISTEALSTALFTHTAYTGESLLEAGTMRDKLLDSINKAIAETQL